MTTALRPSLRAPLVAAALAVTALAGAGVAAQEAQAATTLTSCFTWSTGGVYANQPVNLMRWTGTQWVVVRTGRTGSTGCGTFTSVPSNVYTSMQAHKVLGDANIGLAIYQSAITNWALPGVGGRHLGTFPVRLVHCTWGLYGYCAGQA